MTAPLPPPHPLTPSQRWGVMQARTLVAALGRLARLRHRRDGPLVIERRRYGTHRLETAEIIRRGGRSEASGRAPIVYIHGGGWICGRKELYSRDLAFLAERGHTVFNLDYPLAPEHPHPGPLLALLRALAWLGEIDPPRTGRVHLMGDSAGGNLAGMLGLLLADPDLITRVCGSPAPRGLPDVVSVISLYGVLDRLSWLERGFPAAPLMLECYAGRGAFEAQVGPELAITPLDLTPRTHPPYFIAAGDRDPLCESSRLAIRHLRACGAGRADYVEYPGERHGFFNFDWRPASQRLRSDIDRFLESVEATQHASEAAADEAEQR